MESNFRQIQNKRVFITGGAGFIGSTLVGILLNNGNEVVIFDNFKRNAINDSGFLSHPNLRIIEGDVRDSRALKEGMQGSQIIIHCAAIAGVDTVIKSPTSTLDININGTFNVLNMATEIQDLERVVSFSTSEVFGQHAFRAQETDYTVMGAVGEARWTYAVSKLAGEHLAYSFYKEKRLPTVVVRPFNIYGPGQVGEGALRTFIIRALQGEDIEVHGDGTQIRAWCYVDDMVEGVLRTLTSPEAVGESFNIGNKRAVVTIYGLANAVVRVLQSKSKIKFVEKNYTDVELRIPDVEKAKDMLGFEAKIDLDKGIELTAQYYKDKLNL